MLSQIQIPSRIYAGEGCIGTLSEIVKTRGIKNAVLFTDKGVKNAGLCDEAVSLIKESGAKMLLIDEVKPEPSVQDVNTAIRLADGDNADLVVAIGGGSVMDTAKLASVLIGASYTLFDLLTDPSLAKKTVPTVMVPTTCGTGAEATCNAIVAIPEKNTKQGIVNPALIPDEVLLDVGMIAHLPKAIVAATGVDALAHGVECYTSNKSTPLSQMYALTCVKLIESSIEKAWSNPDDLEAKMNMLLGAFYGGVAITGSGTTAVHALSYPLGGKYHMAHGVSNAVLFAPVMAFNRDACTRQLCEICDTINPSLHGKSEDDKSLYVVDRIAEIVRNTEIPVSLSEFGITREDLDFLVTAGSQQQRLLVNNMKELSLDDIRNIYEQVI